MTARTAGTARTDSPAVRETPLIRILGDVLAYARERDYTGWDYGDGMSSRLLQALPVESKWLNLAVQEVVKRSPVNVRPALFVEQRRNYKGAALFAMANRNFGRLREAVDYRADRHEGVDYDGEARELLDWLVERRSTGYSGFCGGHEHPIQHLDGRGVPNDPDVVSTSYAVQALLDGADLDAAYAETARTAANFVLEDLNYREVDGGARIDYHMNHSDDYYTVNAGALGARLLVDLHDYFDLPGLRERARALLDHIADLQTDAGGWTYRVPADASHLSMDNHHNGFVVEAFLRYRDAVETARYADTVERALAFYRGTLFDDDGAPNYDETAAFPRDIHACAQGVLTFTYAGDLETAERILEWTVEHLYGGDGRFFFREHRLYTQRHVLMRWCEAWMAYAISEYLTAVSEATETYNRN